MATIKVSIKEEIVINGSDIGSENVFVDSNIVYADRRVMTVNAVGFEPIMRFSNKVGNGVYADNSAEYIRITNLSDSISVYIQILVSAGATNSAFFVIEPRGSFILNNNQFDAYADITSTFSAKNIDSIEATSASSTADIEYLIVG